MKERLIRPIALGAFCLTLAGVFLATALLDILRTEETLKKVFYNKGVTVLENINLLAQERLRDFLSIYERSSVEKEPIDIEQGFRVQEAVFLDLIDLTSKVWDYLGKGKAGESLRELVSEQNLAALYISWEDGRTLYEPQPLPEGLLGALLELKKEPQDVQFEQIVLKTPYFVIGKLTPDNKAKIYLALDKDGLMFWAIKTVLEEASGLSFRRGLLSVRVLDPKGRTVFNKIYETIDPKESLEVSSPLFIGNGYTAWAQISIREVIELKDKNTKHILYSTVGMAVFAIFLTLLFHILQVKHERNLALLKEKLMKEQRLSALGRLAAGLAHEIRNPLNAISMAVQRVSLEFQPDEKDRAGELAEITEIVKNEIRRLNMLVEEFVSPMRSKVQLSPNSLIGLVRKAVSVIREEALPKGIELRTSYPTEDIVISMDFPRLYQAVYNVLKNSIDATGRGGIIEIEVSARRPSMAILKIRDSGVGIPQNDLDSIFEMGYTTKEKGLGLGLPISLEIIKGHGGEVLVESSPGRGTTVTIMLPLSMN